MDEGSAVYAAIMEWHREQPLYTSGLVQVFPSPCHSGQRAASVHIRPGAGVSFAVPLWAESSLSTHQAWCWCFLRRATLGREQPLYTSGLVLVFPSPCHSGQIAASVHIRPGAGVSFAVPLWAESSLSTHQAWCWCFLRRATLGREQPRYTSGLVLVFPSPCHSGQRAASVHIRPGAGVSLAVPLWAESSLSTHQAWCWCFLHRATLGREQPLYTSGLVLVFPSPCHSVQRAASVHIRPGAGVSFAVPLWAESSPSTHQAWCWCFLRCATLGREQPLYTSGLVLVFPLPCHSGQRAAPLHIRPGAGVSFAVPLWAETSPSKHQAWCWFFLRRATLGRDQPLYTSGLVLVFPSLCHSGQRAASLHIRPGAGVSFAVPLWAETSPSTHQAWCWCFLRRATLGREQPLYTSGLVLVFPSPCHSGQRAASVHIRPGAGVFFAVPLWAESSLGTHQTWCWCFLRRATLGREQPLYTSGLVLVFPSLCHSGQRAASVHIRPGAGVSFAVPLWAESSPSTHQAWCWCFLRRATLGREQPLYTSGLVQVFPSPCHSGQRAASVHIRPGAGVSLAVPLWAESSLSTHQAWCRCFLRCATLGREQPRYTSGLVLVFPSLCHSGQRAASVHIRPGAGVSFTVPLWAESSPSTHLAWCWCFLRCATLGREQPRYTSGLVLVFPSLCHSGQRAAPLHIRPGAGVSFAVPLWAESSLGTHQAWCRCFLRRATLGREQPRYTSGLVLVFPSPCHSGQRAASLHIRPGAGVSFAVPLWAESSLGTHQAWCWCFLRRATLGREQPLYTSGLVLVFPSLCHSGQRAAPLHIRPGAGVSFAVPLWAESSLCTH
ncbi:hypothetical protein NDU88_005304 [Pleurodeles waltl]|uniref:Uncharacterized protein n=1 Tax=Pleurodeles waltl TaxID=8319 RepID=A0AAV7V7I4_PLEWA|nr:hypothetical protein NDU88_005304 [Pleurodeles waltl]